MTLRTKITEARRLQKFLYSIVRIDNKHMEFHTFSNGTCGYSIIAKTTGPKSVKISTGNAEALCQYSKIPSVSVGYQYIDSYLKFGIENHLCFVILIEVGGE